MNTNAKAANRGVSSLPSIAVHSNFSRALINEKIREGGAFDGEVADSRIGDCDLATIYFFQEQLQQQLRDLKADVEALLAAPTKSTAVVRPVRNVLSPKQARIKVRKGNTMFYRAQNPNDPKFDETFPISFATMNGRARGYFEDELDAWLEQQAAKEPRRQRSQKGGDK